MASYSVLFVCMGNICRSPTAEGVFRHKAMASGMDLNIDSAGTGGWHQGEAPDERAQAAAAARGYDLSQIRARQVTATDFDHFDYVLAMDSDNLRNLQYIRPAASKAKLALFMDYATDVTETEVPDPYYGGVNGFEQVLDMVEAASEGLIATIKSRQT
ncbi:MAG: low molecular weight phosphotyrosine protein phosphatase [Pseudomonadales bacterium]|nr:low molecular weight phosphotyrosine protein phosphatase [Pseudomonadales bacterium]